MTAVQHGLPAAPGIGIGTLVIYLPAFQPAAPTAGLRLPPEVEWQSFMEACRRLDSELAQQAQSPNSLIAELFAAHRVILQDVTLTEGVRSRIFGEGESALGATQRVISELAEIFHSFDDEYFAGRSIDILDLGHRLMAHMGASTARSQLSNLPPETILLAHDLTPSELALLPPAHVQGIGLANSTPTAHSAILAHSMGIPMVSTLGPAILQCNPDRLAIIDGTRGLLLIEPAHAEREHYETLRQTLLEQRLLARRNAQSEAITQDGLRVPVYANANSPADVAQAAVAGADGIGLLRTEYLFRERLDPPSQEEQTAAYVEFAHQVSGPLTVRALDAGGDKPVRYISHPREANPFLGLRGIRLLIEQPHLLITQYRALQAAAQLVAHAPEAPELRFMLPMISTLDEIHIVQRLLQPAHAERPPLPIGIMIEVPSAALLAHALAPLVDFFSIGTNDLAQYTLAGDRTNSAVARLADPLHPAVLQLIHRTCQAAQAYGKPVSLCGEIAGDPLTVPLLLGLGVTELSAPLPDIAHVKAVIRSQSLAECRQLGQAALACHSTAQVHHLLAEYTKSG